MALNKQEILKQYFGYEHFREGQEQLIDKILAGSDVVGVMPTGAGKSICFQVPAMMFDGVALVISPLISLMKDQVNALTQAGIQAAYINSSLNERQIGLVLRHAQNGMYKIIYAAPERLETSAFLRFAHSVDISMVTVDEAHCISQWGQDFRPSYRKIADFVNGIPRRPVVSAFTATATPKVREDIVSLLELKNPTVLVTGFDRKNLYFEIQKPKDKFNALTSFLSDKKDRSGIVYCSTRNAVEEVCDGLKERGYSASRYHAGLSDEERHRNQDDFLYDRVQIMVATNAFGMGIDKSNVSFVVHYNMPKNIESYYQEAGRAGRDGENAQCLLLYSGQDVRTALYMIENGKDMEYPDIETEIRLKELDRQRLKEMTFYCHTTDCLRAYILRYFGERAENFCGNCGSCNSHFETVDVTVDAQKILSCVYRARESYGIKMIIDILRGSKNEKLLRLGLDKLSTYNICALSEKRIRDIINYLVLNNFLYTTNSEYPVLKLGSRAGEVLQEHLAVEMKLLKEMEKIEKVVGKSADVQPVNTVLFNQMKELRKTIANEQNVPAFVIFSDSTLTDMCMKMPANGEEFLWVSGVGQVKLERYGEQFLRLIAEFADTEAAQPMDIPAKFHSTDVEISEEPVTVSVIADRINCQLMQAGYPKLSGIKINTWLISEGFMRVETDLNGKNIRIHTAKGTEIGITAQERIICGQNCIVNLYGRAAQEMIVFKTMEIIRYNA